MCLPNSYADFTHQRCVVTGWGKDAFGHTGDYQQILKEVDVPVIDRHTCQYALQEARLGRDYHLPEGFICAGGEKGKDSCKVCKNFYFLRNHLGSVFNLFDSYIQYWVTRKNIFFLSRLFFQMI